jgi:hypothetical protein
MVTKRVFFVLLIAAPAAAVLLVAHAPLARGQVINDDQRFTAEMKSLANLGDSVIVNLRKGGVLIGLRRGLRPIPLFHPMFCLQHTAGQFSIDSQSSCISGLPATPQRENSPT